MVRSCKDLQHFIIMLLKLFNCGDTILHPTPNPGPVQIRDVRPDRQDDHLEDGFNHPNLHYHHDLALVI